MMLSVIQARSCGECTVCCTLPIVHELGKPGYTDCKDLVKGKGCGIYDTRPPVCVGFECLWLSEEHGKYGFNHEGARPDKCGLLFTVVHPHAPIFPAIDCMEVWDGAADTYWGERILAHLIKRVVVIVSYRDKIKKLIGPPFERRRVETIMAGVDSGKTPAFDPRNPNGDTK